MSHLIMPNSTVFLDTTTIVDHVLNKGSKERIDKILKAHSKKIGSQYAKMEIKKGVLQHLILLHNKLVTYPTFQSVLDSLQRISRTPQRNRLSTMLEAISKFFAEIASTRPSEIKKKYGEIPVNEFLQREASSYLRFTIRRLWKNIDKLFDEVKNPMDCFLDIAEPYLDNHLYKNDPRECKGSKIECKIKKFFQNNQKEFEKIIKAVEKITDKDEETIKRLKSLKDIVRLLPYPNRLFSNKEQNVKECWYCSDAILTVLSPPDAKILTSNIKHYQPICQAVGKDLLTYI